MLYSLTLLAILSCKTLTLLELKPSKVRINRNIRETTNASPVCDWGTRKVFERDNILTSRFAGCATSASLCRAGEDGGLRHALPGSALNQTCLQFLRCLRFLASAPEEKSER